MDMIYNAYDNEQNGGWKRNEKTKFKNCDLRGANLDCEGLETCDLEGALYDNMTVWHESYNVTEHGGIKME